MRDDVDPDLRSDVLEVDLRSDEEEAVARRRAGCGACIISRESSTSEEVRDRDDLYLASLRCRS